MASRDIVEDVPRRIRHYAVEATIGSGANGVVYSAIDTRTGHRVALKVLGGRGRLTGQLVEPALLSALNHPNIVRLEDYFLDGENVVLVLEHVDGPNLAEYVESCGGSLAADEVRVMLAQLLRAVDHAHGLLIEHRDIKPENILVTERSGERRFVLSDFGVGQMRAGVGLAMTRTIVGTYAYMSPEQIRGRPGAASDIWALGVVAYSCLAGARPFEGRTVAELTEQILFAHPPLPAESSEESVSELSHMVLRMLEKHSWERGSARELRKALHLATSDNRYTESDSRFRAIAWEQDTRARIRRHVVIASMMFLILALDNLIVPTALVAAAGYLIYRGYNQRADGALKITAAMLLIVVANFAVYVVEQLKSEIFSLSYEEMGIGFTLLSIPFSVLAARSIFEVERARRELFLLVTIRNRTAQPDALLSTLHDYLDTHEGDILVHQFYVDTLLDLKRHEQAAVEAKLIVYQDSHNFSANLSLAHALLSLGLADSAKAVCQNYLLSAAHCFEFRQLLQDIEATK